MTKRKCDHTFRLQTKRGAGIRGGETNGNMLDSNISKGHGHQSSHSHSPLGRGGGVRVTTHAKEKDYMVQTTGYGGHWTAGHQSSGIGRSEFIRE